MVLNFKIKICGVTNIDDAMKAVEFGADAIGLNFYFKSLRCVESATALSISNAVRKVNQQVKIVGVFANETSPVIREIVNTIGLDFVQLHGDEQPELSTQLNQSMLIRAVRIKPNQWDCGIQEIACWARSGVESFLLDAAADGSYGGTGRLLDWNEFAKLKDHFNRDRKSQELKFVLAGGLTPENVIDAIRVARPDAVDVASGVEGFPGKKNHQSLKHFIENSLTVI